MWCQWAACVGCWAACVGCCCAHHCGCFCFAESCSENERNKYMFQKKPRRVEKVLEILIIYSRGIYPIVKHRRVLFREFPLANSFPTCSSIQNKKNEPSPIPRCSSPPRKAHPERCCPEEELRLQGRRLRQRRQAGHAQGC